MYIYVETNFVFELVFVQEQFDSCETIISNCGNEKSSLILPAYCLVEPHEKLTRQAKQRIQLQQNLEIELKQLSRTSVYQKQLNNANDFSFLLTQSNKDEKKRFNSYLELLLEKTEIIPLTSPILLQSAWYESEYNLTPQDSIVYASVITHLKDSKPTTSCFLNRNSKDFDNPSIKQELLEHNCLMIPKFDDGLKYIQSQLNIT